MHKSIMFLVYCYMVFQRPNLKSSCIGWGINSGLSDARNFFLSSTVNGPIPCMYCSSAVRLFQITGPI